METPRKITKLKLVRIDKVGGSRGEEGSGAPDTDETACSKKAPCTLTTSFRCYVHFAAQSLSRTEHAFATFALGIASIAGRKGTPEGPEGDDDAFDQSLCLRAGIPG